ncbi:MAG: CRISPR-associated endonuclease Cas2 [Propionibacteriaceae bacterium]|jgi:CRISPR-associated protein Cas2|nr:CRISPR-associated endonuclease Cas2 [Propionibacteriaceae bacterium]
MALTTIIAYDIHEDWRRARLAALIQRYGDRVQYSVFACRLELSELTSLLEQAATIVDEKVDSIYAFRQCQDCWEAIRTIGQARPPEPVLYWAVF